MAIVLPWKCHSGHIMALCDKRNNCTKFQFYTKKVFRDIPFFVILHHFVKRNVRRIQNIRFFYILFEVTNNV